ncbi:MAG: translation elongation factor Ts, partial [Acidocella sp. 35-58-6]
MAEITAALVKDLRETSGAGMMDCKKALVESDGDMQGAIDWLRKKGLSAAAKKSGRVASEGLVGIALSAGKGAMVEINAETDFVARNEAFQAFVETAAKIALTTGEDVDALKAAPYPGSERNVADELVHLVATIGENMTVRRAAVLEVGKGVIGHYIHNAVSEGLGKIGVLVALESPGKTDELTALGRQLAMHVASSNPLALDASGVDPEIVKREKDVLADKFRQQGKPEAMIEKIVESGLKTYYKEVCLL